MKNPFQLSQKSINSLNDDEDETLSYFPDIIDLEPGFQSE